MNMWKRLMSVCICGVLMMGMAQICVAEETANASETTSVAASETPETTEVAKTPEASETAEPTATPAPVATATSASVNVKVVVNGEPVDFSDKSLGSPMVMNGRTYLPLHQLTVALGGRIAWRSIDNTAHVLRNGVSIRVSAGNPMMTINEFAVGSRFMYTTKDREVAIVDNVNNVTPFVKVPENRMMVPFASLVRELGGETRWSQEDMTVYVTIAAVPTMQSDIDAQDLIANWNYIPKIDPKALIEQGKVTVRANRNDMAPIVGATIELGDQTATTNAQGICVFENVVAGDYEVKVIAAGNYEVLPKFENVTVTVEDEDSIFVTLFFKAKEEKQVAEKAEEKTEEAAEAEKDNAPEADAAE